MTTVIKTQPNNIWLFELAHSIIHSQDGTKLPTDWNWHISFEKPDAGICMRNVSFIPYSDWERFAYYRN